jgi:transcriptional regulator with XRE-family HTH domain
VSIIVSSDLTASIAETVRAARESQGLSANALAERSGVSRAMIAKVERAEAQPTAALLGRLSAALGLTLSELVARAEQSDRRLARAAEQPTWTDPETGYRRRALSPVSGGPLELVEVELPADAEIAYPADSYAFIHQQLWMLDGSLTIVEGELVHELERGDCLEFGAPSARTFLARSACRYLVAITRRA